MDRSPGLSVRLKLTLSYAAFLMVACLVLVDPRARHRDAAYAHCRLVRLQERIVVHHERSARDVGAVLAVRAAVHVEAVINRAVKQRLGARLGSAATSGEGSQNHHGEDNGRTHEACGDPMRRASRSGYGIVTPCSVTGACSV